MNIVYPKRFWFWKIGNTCVFAHLFLFAKWPKEWWSLTNITVLVHKNRTVMYRPQMDAAVQVGQPGKHKTACLQIPSWLPHFPENCQDWINSCNVALSAGKEEGAGGGRLNLCHHHSAFSFLWTIHRRIDNAAIRTRGEMAEPSGWRGSHPLYPPQPPWARRGQRLQGRALSP